MGLFLWILLLVVILIAVLFLRALYYFFTRTLPGPFPWPIFGEFPRFMLGFGGESPKYLRYHDQIYPGKTFEIWFFGTRVLFSNDQYFMDYIMNQNAKNWLARSPDNDPSIPARSMFGLYNQGLISNDNIERWKFQRAIFLKSLRNDLLVHAGHLASQKVAQAVNSLSAHLNSNGQIDANAFVRRLITDVVFLVAFGEDLNTSAGGPNEIAKYVTVFFETWIYISLTPTLIWKIFGRKRMQRYLDNQTKLRAIVDRVIQKEKIFLATFGKESITKPNFIQMLLLASMEPSPNSDMQLSNEEIRQCALEMILGGTDTSVNITANLMYAVAEHPQIEEKIRAEIESFHLKETEFPSAQQLSEMKYNEAVIKETLRLYPVIELAVRCSRDDDVVTGIPVPKQTWVIGSLFPRPSVNFPPDPDVFRPERFLEKSSSSSSASPCSFIPFGSGPRNCVGQYLAMIEMKAVVFEVYRRLKLRLPEGKSMKTLKTSYDLVRHPAEPMWLYAEPTKMN